MKKLLLGLATISCTGALQSQSTVVLNHLRVQGNAKTKIPVFVRETGFTPGYVTGHADSLCKVWQQRLSGLNLFNLVEVEHHGDTVSISVKERIYNWALPELSWADRNFNVWWQSKDPNRLIYGFTGYFNNIGGLNHNLSITAIHGFNRSYSFRYTRPFSAYRKSWGYSLGAGYWSNHELWYKTESDKLQFLRLEAEPVQRNFWSQLILRRRINYFNRVEATLGYGGIRIADSAQTQDKQGVLNYIYGLNRNYLETGISFVSDSRDQRDYPGKGHLIRLSLSNNFMNLKYSGPSVYQFEARINKFTPLKPNWVLATGLVSRYRIDNRALMANTLPYLFSRQFGYGSDYVRGYEPYVAEGSGMFLAKMALRRALLQGYKLKIRHGNVLNNYRMIPLNVWFNIFADAGRTIKPTVVAANTLNREWMMGSGIGLDITAWYSAMARFELSRNRMGNWIFNISYINAF
jgi:outer membrane protein assembly factor BamA